MLPAHEQADDTADGAMLDSYSQSYKLERAMRVLFLFLTGFSLLFCGCSKDGEGDVKKSHGVVSRTIKAETARAVVQLKPAMETVSGRIMANEEVLLATRASGFLEKSFCEVGRKVKDGEVLFRLDSNEITARLDAVNAEITAMQAKKISVEADMSYLSSNYNRIETLKKKDAATPDEFERAKSRLDAIDAQSKSLDSTMRQLEASAREVKSQMAYTQIKSPVNGIITSCPVDAGSFISPGMTLARIDSFAHGYSLLARVDQSYLQRIKVGEELLVDVPDSGIKGMCKIQEISPSVDPDTNTFAVKVAVSGETLRSGVFGRLYLSRDTQNLVMIPLKAVVKRGGLSGVYVVNDDKSIQWRLVRTGVDFDEFVSVLSGLENGEMLVVSNLSEIREGMRLE